MKKNTKRLLILISLILVVFTMYKILTTYAIFYSELTGNTSATIGKWNIVVNDTDISDGQTKTFTIDQIEVTKSDFVREGKISPGLTGSFKIVIDPSNTQTSIQYTISLDKSNLTTDRIKIINVVETEYNNTLTTEDDKYIGIMKLADIEEGKTNTILIEIQWEDDGTYNEEDAIIGTSENATLDIPISVDVIQYLGEAT